VAVGQGDVEVHHLEETHPPGEADGQVFLLGVGAVLASYQVLGRGVAFNSLKVIGFSLPVLRQDSRGGAPGLEA
jgi:hypothetical protein